MILTDKWVVGFVDGDGCFRMIESKEGKRYCFVVSQHKRSKDVLYGLKKKFACGSVNKAGQNMFEYRVTNKKHLTDIILPFFVKNPLQTVKLKDFETLYEDLNGACQDSLKGTNVTKKLTFLKTPICRDWLLGFIDAEANFYVSMVRDYPRPQFSIGLHLRDKQILEEIKSFMGCGLIYIKKPKKGNDYVTYQISSLPAFLEIIKICTTGTNRCLLKTSKRISFLKFKQIVRIIQQKKHTTPEGIVIIKTILKQLNCEP